MYVPTPHKYVEPEVSAGLTRIGYLRSAVTLNLADIVWNASDEPQRIEGRADVVAPHAVMAVFERGNPALLGIAKTDAAARAVAGLAKTAESRRWREVRAPGSVGRRLRHDTGSDVG